MVDRVDLWVPVEHISYEQLDSDAITGNTYENSESIGLKIMNSRDFSKNRAIQQNVVFPNYKLSAKDISQVSLTAEAKKILQSSAIKLQMSPRAYHRVIKIARTIADMDVSFSVTERHILEALQFRPKSPIVAA